MLVLWCWFVACAAEPAPSDPGALLTRYDAVRGPLAEDRLDAAREAARTLAADIGLAGGIRSAAQKLADAPDAAAARVAFGDLSRAVVVHYESTGVPDGVKVYHCPMAPGYAYWLQEKAGIANPYMGTSMPTCGEGTSFKVAAKATAEAKP